MKLTISSRQARKNNQIRREGKIPAVVYSGGKDGEMIVINANDWLALIKQIKPGCLSTTIFTLVGENGKEIRAILKDIQYQVTTYNVLHLDFLELQDSVPVSLNIPLQCTGVVDCVGVKLGGNLRQVIRAVPVRCLPKDIPSEFQIDVRDLAIGQSRRLSDIEMPAGVRALAPLNEVAVVIAKR